MQWYYSRNDTPVGPVPEDEFQTLVRNGTITPDTLVWREDMTSWQPLRATQATPPGETISTASATTVKCVECGNQVAPEDALQYQGSRVCARCKPVFFQKIKEGAENIGGAALWRSGKYLVMKKGGTLPDRCIKCNAPAEGYQLRRKLSWHNPLLYVLIFVCNPLIYILVAAVVSKRAVVGVGLCPAHRERRRKQITINLGLCAAGFFMIGAGIAFNSVAVGVLGGVVLLGCLIFAVIITNVVAAGKIDDQYARMRGVCPAYLESLDKWMGGD
ncbi:MAG: DUF4339 domain-containing protein [Verrucomicrobiota bacterium]